MIIFQSVQIFSAADLALVLVVKLNMLFNDNHFSICPNFSRIIWSINALFKCLCLQQAAEGVQGAVCGFFLGCWLLTWPVFSL